MNIPPLFFDGAWCPEWKKRSRRRSFASTVFLLIFEKDFFTKKTNAMKNNLSPSDLAEPIVQLILPDAEYDFVRQTRFDTLGPDMTITWNATHTFGADGKPKDLDNDR
jgi:hypothetical protein